MDDIHALRMVEGSDDWIEGLGMPFGGPFQGQDVEGEHFSKSTDFAFDWFPDGRPLLYHHGLNDGAGISVVGRVTDWSVKADLGVWVKAQLDASNEYFSAIKELIKKGKLFFSSGSMRHLVDVQKKSGEIKRWPWVELSLTPTPSNMLAEVDFAKARKHFELAGLKADLSVLEDDEVKADITATKPGFEETENQIRYRVHDPEGFEEGGFRTITPNGTEGIQFVIGRRKGEDTTTVQSVRFDKDNWTMARARQWIEAHPKLEAGKAVDGEMGIEVGEKSITDIAAFIIDEDKDTIAELNTIPIGDYADMTSGLAAVLVERTKDLYDRRLKEGRVISMANKDRISATIAAMRKTADELQGLVDSTAPAKAAIVWQLELLELATPLVGTK